MHRRHLATLRGPLVALTLLLGPAPLTAEPLKVTLDPTAPPLHSFIPARTQGAGIDGHEPGATHHLLRGPNLARMKDDGSQRHRAAARTGEIGARPQTR